MSSDDTGKVGLMGTSSGEHAQARTEACGSSRYLLPSNELMFFAVAALVVAVVHPAIAYGYDDDLFGDVCKRSMSYVEGGFGALLAAVAGFGALIASAAGGFRVAWALLVVSIGAYIVRSYLTIWFGSDCGTGDGAAPAP